MPAPTEISQLVELFERNYEQYRDQFIDPLFIALGWDVNNTQGLATQPHHPEGRPRCSGGSR
jgi:predicted type IV restriction endonuclease